MYCKIDRMASQRASTLILTLNNLIMIYVMLGNDVISLGIEPGRL